MGDSRRRRTYKKGKGKCGEIRRKNKNIANHPKECKETACFFFEAVLKSQMLVKAVYLWEVKELPNIQSAKKRVKVSKTKNLRNRMVKSGVKTSIKKFNAALAEGAQPAAAQLSATTSAIDKAVAKGVIKKNAANRKKARMALAINKASNA